MVTNNDLVYDLRYLDLGNPSDEKTQILQAVPPYPAAC